MPVLADNIEQDLSDAMPFCKALANELLWKTVSSLTLLKGHRGEWDLGSYFTSPPLPLHSRTQPNTSDILDAPTPTDGISQCYGQIHLEARVILVPSL